MDFGLQIFPTDYAATPGELGRIAEEAGFESLFFPEHTHIPASRITPWPGGGDLPQQYWHTYDPFVASMAALAATKTLKVGPGICLIVQRDPIITANEVASVDRLSGGRFLFGIGAGWNREEMENHGTDPKTRFALMGEQVKAMKEIWTQDEASFHGKYVDFDPIWSWPKPVQKPHPPILVGGWGPTVEQRVIEYGDEWIPLPGGSFDALRTRISSFRDQAEAAGRSRLGVSFVHAPPDLTEMEAFERAGVTRYVFSVPSVGIDESSRIIEGLSDVVEQYRSAGG